MGERLEPVPDYVRGSHPDPASSSDATAARASTRFATAFLLRDLVEAPGLGLRLVTPEEGGMRHVSGAHSIEIEHPSRWLAPDWVALTTGLRLRDDETAQREVVAELDDAHIAALGFAVDIYFPSIPAALLAEAERRAFPVFEVPIETGFRAIASYVFDALRSNDVREYQKLLSMQRYLLDAIGAARARSAVIERLADFAGGSALIVNAAGEVVVASDTRTVEAVRAVWPTLNIHPRRAIQTEAGDVQLAAAPVRASGRHGEQWLVFVSTTGWATTRVALRALQAAVPILEAVSKVEELEAEQDSMVEGSALSRALGLDETETIVAPCMAVRGLDFSEGVAMLCVFPQAADAEPPSASSNVPLATALRRELDDVGVRTITASTQRRLLVAAQGDRDALIATLEEFCRDHPTATIGVGRPVTDVGELRGSLRDAETAALEVGAGDAPRLRSYEDVPLPAFLTTEVGHDRFAAKAQELLAPLRAEPTLYETLAALFEHNLDIPRTARSLHFHANTVRFRIENIVAALGASLLDPATIAAIHTALTGARREALLSAAT
jgi:purine catabolism regulator